MRTREEIWDEYLEKNNKELLKMYTAKVQVELLLDIRDLLTPKISIGFPVCPDCLCPLNNKHSCPNK